ncbi:MAG: L-aspartate oxidase [Opitutus sp.]|nr:L-aspartate oxidase [Opitutus sp.]MCS6247214.1 L-aspartate oxidase [Opitutus sp.]MCS6273962.1 L-aspartate oxidase [Opitutus sp.]MCS6278658.1 L-aspartate oxidase [Opitutus sp.]MCS6298529.1 L-aspartate oxidase [Opitutus sp.]
MSTGPSFDVLVIGSGIAGLSFALKAARLGRSVAILTKKNQAESNTNYAQGGIAVVTGKTDDVDKHVQDTLVAGDGLCDEKVVREIVRDGPARVQELVELGLEFSRDASGSYDLGREGGHTERRVLHVKDMTGKAIESALIKALSLEPRIAMYEHMFAIDIITRRKLAPKTPKRDDRVLGVYALDVRDGHVLTFEAPVVMLSTGGAGQAYLYTTNPDIATGDGIAMAYRAGIEVRNMEFIQFHPTALYSTSGLRFLITEAVRGEGAILRNAAGEAFMKDYHPMADLAPRDIVARAIDTEMKKSGVAHVWLDITHRNEAFLRTRFPLIYKTCKDIGINIAKAMIPVVPAAHYTCGGVATNLSAETSLPGLYACGEVACTGLHGANRLASNSLLEAVVMAHRGSLSVDRYLKKALRLPVPAVPAWVDLGGGDVDERVVVSHNWDELRRTLWDYVSIMRTTRRLERARTRIANLSREIQDYYWNFSVDARLLELRNLTQVAEMIVACALQRKESRGLHAIADYPKTKKVARDSRVVKN